MFTDIVESARSVIVNFSIYNLQKKRVLNRVKSQIKHNTDIIISNMISFYFIC